MNKVNAFRLQRLHADLSIDEAVKIIGITKNYLQKIETNHSIPSRDTLIKIAKCYKCKVDDLL